MWNGSGRRTPSLPRGGSCTGAPMTLAEIDAHIGNLALYQFKIRERDCKRNQGSTPTCTD